MCFMFYACLILLYVFISGMLCNAVIRNKRIHNPRSSSSEEEEQQAAAQDPYTYDEVIYETIEREKKEEDFDKVPSPVSRK